jgi:hypothetical protein
MRNFFILALISLIWLSCNKENNNNTIPAGYQMVIGNTNNAVYYSNLTVPDSTIIETEHQTTREISLDGDTVAEFYIISEFDTLNNEVEFKSLRIQKNLDFNGTLSTYVHPVVELLSPDYFADGEVVIIGDVLYPFDQVLYLAQIKDNFVSDEQELLGVWNGANKLYFIIRFDKDDKKFVSWVRISVINFDQYILFNYATFEM